VNVKLSLCFLNERNAMNAYWGNGGIAACILDLGTRWSVVSFTPRPLYPQESLVPIGQETGLAPEPV